jgi:hypothetical protein
MRARQGQRRLGWASVGVAALALAAGVLLWFAAPREDSSAVDSPATVTTRASAAAALPTPREDDTPSLPAHDASAQPVQPLAPAEIPAAPPSPVAGAPRSFGSLDLTLVQPDGQPAAGALVALATPRTTWKPEPGARPRLDADEAGHVAWPIVPAETELQLTVTDALGIEVAAVVALTLGPREHREQTLRIDCKLRSVVVRVVDTSAAGLSAEVTLQATRDASQQPVPRTERTDAHGRVAFVGLAAERVDVWAVAPGYSPMWRGQLTLDRDPLEIVLTLENGPRVDVEIADLEGRPRDVDSLQLVGVPMCVLADRIAPGLYRFPAFPRAATGIIASVQGRRWSVSHSASEPVAHLVVPASGSLSVTWAPLPLDCEPNGIFISSEPSAWGWFEPIDAATLAGHGPVLFETLAPGDYSVRLNCPDSKHAQAVAELSARATVQSGKTAQLRIEP